MKQVTGLQTSLDEHRDSSDPEALQHHHYGYAFLLLNGKKLSWHIISGADERTKSPLFLAHPRPDDK